MYFPPKMDNWDDMLRVLVSAVSNSYQDRIKDTPFCANYGKHPHVPDDIKREGSPIETLTRMISLDIEKAIVKKKFCLENAQHCQKKH